MDQKERTDAKSFVTDMEVVSESGNLDLVKALLKEWYMAGKPLPEHLSGSGPFDPFSLSMVAAIENKHLDIIAYLMDESFPINAVASYAAARVGSVRVYQTFLDHGWNINEVPYHGTASFKFVRGNATLRSWFLAHGADPNVTDHHGISPLTVAAACTPVSFLERLLKHGGDPARSEALFNAVGIRGAEGIEKASLLLDYGAPVNGRRFEWDPTPFKEICQRTSAYTPLHCAVGTGNEEMVALLVSRGADPLFESRFGLTPLEMARGIQEPPFFKIAEILRKGVEDRTQPVQAVGLSRAK